MASATVKNALTLPGNTLQVAQKVAPARHSGHDWMLELQLAAQLVEHAHDPKQKIKPKKALQHVPNMLQTCQKQKPVTNIDARCRALLDSHFAIAILLFLHVPSLQILDCKHTDLLCVARSAALETACNVQLPLQNAFKAAIAVKQQSGLSFPTVVVSALEHLWNQMQEKALRNMCGDLATAPKSRVPFSLLRTCSTLDHAVWKALLAPSVQTIV